MTVTTEANGVADHVDVGDEGADGNVSVLVEVAVVPKLGDVVEDRSVRIDVELVRLVTLVEGV